MSVSLQTRQAGDVAVIDLAGRIMLGESAENLRDTLRALIAKGERKILLNLSGVFYMDSSGVGALAGGHATVAGKGGALRLVGLNKRVSDLLKMTHLDSVFDIHEEESHALRTFV